MRQIVFNEHLKDYLMDVSGQKTLNIHKLVNMCKKNYRLFDSLILYCALNKKKELFNRYTNNRFAGLIESINEQTFLTDAFKDYDFAKIWESYQHRINRFSYDERIKERIRNNTISLIKQKEITNYRVYTDLKLNPGNINDYLTNGNVKKVSLKTAKRIFLYVSLL